MYITLVTALKKASLCMALTKYMSGTFLLNGSYSGDILSK